jgi:type II secretory pathway predicted ATPase ExeA
MVRIKNSQHKKNPFLSAVDETSFYPYPAMNHCLDELSSAFSGLSRIVLVLGDFGSGKSLMMKQFLAENPALWKPCKVNPREMDATESFGPGKPLREHKAYLYRTDEKTALLMDDAHNLDIDELLFLLRLTGLGGGESQTDKLVFFAETSLLQFLDELSELLVEEGTVSRILMPRLSKLEAETYILKRLDSVDFKGGKLFTSSEPEWIYDESGGYPGGINEVAARIFSQKTKEDGKFSKFFKNFF